MKAEYYMIVSLSYKKMIKLSKLIAKSLGLKKFLFPDIQQICTFKPYFGTIITCLQKLKIKGL